jgi:hypothetical protein
VSAPPHSLDPPPPGSREDFFTGRNNFLFLVLGLISTAETVLRIAPQLGESEDSISKSSDGLELPAGARIWR